jgi:hypothetical protein
VLSPAQRIGKSFGHCRIERDDRRVERRRAYVMNFGAFADRIPLAGDDEVAAR